MVGLLLLFVGAAARLGEIEEASLPPAAAPRRASAPEGLDTGAAEALPRTPGCGFGLQGRDPAGPEKESRMAGG